MTLDALTEEIWRRIGTEPRRALLIGSPPCLPLPYDFVEQKPYHAVVIGILPPGELLQMPSNAVCDALLDDIPVWYDRSQPFRKANKAGALCRRLAEAECALFHLGVMPLPAEEMWITAQDVIRSKEHGLTLSKRKLTPLAQELLEER